MKRRLIAAVAATFVSGCPVALAEAQHAPHAILERVVLLSRHGVRSPTETSDRLTEKTGYAWPSWSVAPGEMTAHGASALATMGTFLRERYETLGVLPRTGCGDPGAVAVWADSSDHRTRQSGQVLADTLAPGCHLSARWRQQAGEDPVFNAAASGICPLDEGRSMAALDEAIAAPIPDDARAALATLQARFAPHACQDAKKTCLLRPVTAAWKNGAPHLSGGLTTAATAAENLLLEYEEGMSPAADSGARNEAEARSLIAAAMPAHRYETALMRRLPELAAHRGAVMARLVLDTLAHGPARLLVLAGHDSNLDMLSPLFGLHWDLPEQPDQTAPDTTLAFELWRMPSGEQVVRTVVFFQSPDQVRHLLPLDHGGTPHSLDVIPAACAASSSRCGLDLVAHAVEAAIPAACHAASME